MSVHIAIPVEKESKQLDRTIDLLNQHTKSLDYKVYIDPSINVAEAREQIINNYSGKYICFLDYDSEMFDSEWLPKMLQTMERQEATLVFAPEYWGSDKDKIQYSCNPYDSNKDHLVGWGPAACMLIDKSKLPVDIHWDFNIGLRNGWLGGDFEEVDWARRLIAKGCKFYFCGSTAFNHTGGKTSFSRYHGSDRGRTSSIMSMLVMLKYRKAPDNMDFFKNLKYVKADPNNDNKLAPGQSLRTCYHDVIKDNGLGYIVDFQQLGLV